MSRSDQRPVVVWDVDDVLNELMREWFEGWWRPAHPECVRQYSEITANPPHAVLGIREAAYLESLDAFREARFAHLIPRAEVLAWFEGYGDRAHHVALSAPPEAFASHSASWVMKHFGRWIRTYAFVPAKRGRPEVADPRIAKKAYLEWLGHGDVFVDDREGNVADVRSLGLRGIVMPQPWNAAPHRTFESALQELTALVAPGAAVQAANAAVI